MCLLAEIVYYSPLLCNGVGVFIFSSSPLKKEIGMRRILLLLFSMAVALLLASGAVLALPSEKPDNTPMVDGRVRAIEQVGTNIWLGGRFSRVEQRNGTVLGNVANVAVFDSKTGKYRKGVAPRLGGTDAEVFDMTIYGDDVLIAGNFAGPTNNKGNLVLVDGTTGKVIRWYDDSPALKSVLGAPKLGRIYGGGVSLSAFDFSTGKRLWSRAKTEVDVMRAHDSKPAYRDLELDADGKTIWAACICDKVGGKAAKALVKLDTGGNHDASWLTQAGTGSFGQSVVEHNGKLFLAAGGSDFVAEFDKTAGGERGWKQDTSGSTQAVAVYDGQLVVGGHFYYVGDDKADKCGAGRPGDPLLDPNGECQRRQGIAAYSLGGRLDPNWHPAYSGSYSLVWDLHTEGLRLHTGGEFKTVSGVTQNSYARLSPAPIKGNNRANTLVGTPDSEAIYGYGGADRIDARGGADTLRLGSGKDKGQGGRGDDYIGAVDGSKDAISCGPGSDRVRANPGDTVTEGCEKIVRAGKRVG
jgi:RTX calcium-binding nonapeptide repeat (4 copies)